MTLETATVRAGQETDGAYRSIAPPIYQTANFRFERAGAAPEYDYSRSGNPTRSALEEILAELEGGAGATALCTGMAAITTTLALFDAGDQILCSHDCYGGTERLLRTLDGQGKITATFVDLTDPLALVDACTDRARAIWIETPSNPLLRIVDIEAVVRFARSRDLLVIVDNTFLSPLFQKPLALGADLVVHSTTKYLNGHSDVVGGAVIAKTTELASRVAWLANALGTVAAPFDSWLILRGIKTLSLRARRHEENAIAVARHLERHPLVSRVFYPGLRSHEGHELALRQQTGFGGVVSFELPTGAAGVSALLDATRVFALAESLGGVESLIEHPATMSHASMTPARRQAAGITDGIIRLSVGVESLVDLITDLDAALAAARTAIVEEVAHV